MRTSIILLLIVIFTLEMRSSQEIVSDTSEVSRQDSVSFLKEIGNTSWKITKVTLKVGGQYFFGLLIGAAGVNIIHQPVIAGAGWLAGSSFGVCVVGNGGRDGRQFLWVLVAGTAGVIPFIPGMTSGGLGAAFSAGFAIITSLTFEVITYYLTDRLNEESVKVGMGLRPVKLNDERASLNSTTLVPTLNIQISL